MRQVVILGGGKIGSLIATLLVESSDYAVSVGDVDSHVVAQLQKEINNKQFQISAIDVQDKTALRSFLEQTKPEAILSSLPYYCNPLVSELALESGAHYFHLEGRPYIHQTPVSDLVQPSPKGFACAQC